MENKFYNELSKFKKAEKVELASIADFDKMFKEAQKASAIAENNGLGKLRKIVLEVDNDFLKLLRVSSEAIDVAKKIEKQAKELGIDLGNEISGKVNVLKGYENTAEYWIKELNAGQYR
jgi:hypothetical protein